MHVRFTNTERLCSRSLLKVLLSAFILLTTFSGFAEKLDGLTYVSPVPGSKHNSVNTTIIIGFKDPILTGIQIEKVIQLLCDKGEIDFTPVVLSGRKKVILKPSVKLPEYSEIRVNVDLNSLLGKVSYGDMVRFSFYTGTSEEPQYSGNEKITTGDGTNYVPSSSATDRTIATDLAKQIPFTTNIRSNSNSGQYLLGSIYAANGRDGLVMVNSKGQMIFDRKRDFMPIDFKMLTPQRFSYINLTATPKDYSCHVMNTNLEVIDTIKPGNGYLLDIHELLFEEKSGHYFLLAQRNVPFDMSALLPFANPNATILDIIIQEIDSNDNVVFEWKCLDHLPVSDAVGVNLYDGGLIDYVHCNALFIDTDSTILLSSRHLNEITRIDRRTGDIIWRLNNNPNNKYFTWLNDTPGFSYQHSVHKLNNGHLLLFDNGNYRVGERFSRAVEYEINEEFRTVKKVWEYIHPELIASDFMGSVQRLPNGNTVIGWGSANPNVTEIDASGNRIFEGTFPTGIMSYRVYKYNLDSLLPSLQPNIKLSDTADWCKLRDPQFEARFKTDLQPYIYGHPSEKFQQLTFNSNSLNVVLEDSSNNFYSYTTHYINFKYAGLSQKDTLFCKMPQGMMLSLSDQCIGSKYKWKSGETAGSLAVSPQKGVNKYYVSISNGSQVQVDSITVNVSPVSDYSITGNPVLDQSYQIITYSIPYYKNVTYDWEVINGNIVSGFDGNAVQVQWGNADKSYLRSLITDQFGCKTYSPWDTISMKKVNGVATYGITDVANVYPNPFTSSFSIESAQPVSYRIYDLNGKLVAFDQTYSTNHTIENNLASGVYVLEIEAESGIYRTKITRN